MRFALATIVLAVVVGPASADPPVSRWEITPTLGSWSSHGRALHVTLFLPTVGSSVVPVSASYSADRITSQGLRVGLGVGKGWTVSTFVAEQTGDLRPDTAFGMCGVSGLPCVPAERLDLTAGEVGVEKAFGAGRFRPFLGLSAGAVWVDVSVGGSIPPRFVWRAGVGGLFDLSGDLALRADVGVHSVRWQGRGGAGTDDWLRFRELSLGLAYRP